MSLFTKIIKWYIGVINGSTPRSLELDLSFIGKGKKNIKAHYDGVNADQQAKDSQLIQYTLPENSNKLSINLCRGGGYIGIINIE